MKIQVLGEPHLHIFLTVPSSYVVVECAEKVAARDILTSGSPHQESNGCD